MDIKPVRLYSTNKALYTVKQDVHDYEKELKNRLQSVAKDRAISERDRSILARMKNQLKLENVSTGRFVK